MKKYNPSGSSSFELYSFCGIVEESGKNMETRVHGGGGGGATYQGTGGTAPVSISSTTVVHDQIFLTRKDGKERAFQLQDFDLACRKGNEVTVFWGIKDGKDKGAYVAVKNHSTDQSFFDEKDLKKLFINGWVQLLLIIGGIIAIFAFSYVGYAIGAGAFFFTWKRWQTATSEINSFKTDIQNMLPE